MGRWEPWSTADLNGAVLTLLSGTGYRAAEPCGGPASALREQCGRGAAAAGEPHGNIDPGYLSRQIQQFRTDKFDT